MSDGWTTATTNKRSGKKDTGSKSAVDYGPKLAKKRCRFFAQGDCVKDKFCEYSHVIEAVAPAKPVKRSLAPVTKSTLPRMTEFSAFHRGAEARATDSANDDECVAEPVVLGSGGFTMIDDNPREREAFDAHDTPGSHATSSSPVVVFADAVGGSAAASVQTAPKLATPAVPCRVFFSGATCRFGAKCKFSHADLGDGCAVSPPAAASSVECAICMESVLDKGERFGLLLNCTHCFCLPCITGWRAEAEAAASAASVSSCRSCPLCREFSAFVIPSLAMVTTTEQKKHLLDQFLGRRKQVPCKYWQGAAAGGCRFGNSCQFSHGEELSRTIVDSQGATVTSVPRSTLFDFVTKPGKQKQSEKSEGPERPVDQLVQQTEKELAKMEFERKQRQ